MFLRSSVDSFLNSTGVAKNMLNITYIENIFHLEQKE